MSGSPLGTLTYKAGLGWDWEGFKKEYCKSDYDQEGRIET
jgi:hypothetical protein